MGFIPIILVFAIFLLVLKKQADNSIRTTLTGNVEQFKNNLEAEMNKFRDYSFFISREALNIIQKSEKGNLSSYNTQVTANRYNLRLFELFKKDKIFYRDMYSWKDHIYDIKPEVATELWETLSNPLYTRHFKISYPDIVSNVLVIRNCSIIYDEKSDTKYGFSAISTPIDNDFLREFGYQSKEQVIVILSENGVEFSNNEFNLPEIKDLILKARKLHKPYTILNLGKLGKYYYYQENLYSSTKRIEKKIINKKIADVGLLLRFDTVNRQITSLIKIIALIFVVVLGLITGISVLFSRSIIPPIMNLKQEVEKFQKNMIPVSLPVQKDDEISILHASFSEMSNTVLQKSEDLTTALTELALANEQLGNMTIMDGLTGVKNRRYFNNKIEKEIKRASRQQKTLSLLMLDIDHFKHINDTYGHQAGDEVLKSIADTLSKHVLRSGDDVARYGGEEFCIILPNTEVDGAAALAEKIRMEIQKKSISYNRKKIKVTISIGVAAIIPADENLEIDKIVNMADSALYEAKETGRNKTVIYH